MWDISNFAENLSFHNRDRQHQEGPFKIAGSKAGNSKSNFTMLNLWIFLLSVHCSLITTEDVHPIIIKRSWKLFLETSFLLHGATHSLSLFMRVHPAWWPAVGSNFWNFSQNVSTIGIWSTLTFSLQMFKFSSAWWLLSPPHFLS